MPDADQKSGYELVELSADHEIGDETFTGQTAKQAALKLARKLPAAPSESEAESNPTEATLRNYESRTEFVFDAWAWTEEASDTDEEWMPDEITEASVDGKQLDDPHEWFVSPHEADRWEEQTDTTSPTDSQLTCPDCDEELPAGANFCRNCGTELSPSECPECETAVEPDDEFCLNCGQEL